MSHKLPPPLARQAFNRLENNLFREMDEEKELDDWMDALFPWDLDHKVNNDPF